jgi:hypothetical protein
MVSSSARNTNDRELFQRGESPIALDDKERGGQHSQFMERYGEGFKLTSKSTSNRSTPPTG